MIYQGFKNAEYLKVKLLIMNPKLESYARPN